MPVVHPVGSEVLTGRMLLIHADPCFTLQLRMTQRHTRSTLGLSVHQSWPEGSPGSVLQRSWCRHGLILFMHTPRRGRKCAATSVVQGHAEVTMSMLCGAYAPTTVQTNYLHCVRHAPHGALLRRAISDVGHLRCWLSHSMRLHHTWQCRSRWLGCVFITHMPRPNTAQLHTGTLIPSCTAVVLPC